MPIRNRPEHPKNGKFIAKAAKTPSTLPKSWFRYLIFSAGDTFPALHYQDGRPYRGQVYTLSELPGLIKTYGLPQVWNAEGKDGPDLRFNVPVWDDEPLRPYLRNRR